MSPRGAAAELSFLAAAQMQNPKSMRQFMRDGQRMTFGSDRDCDFAVPQSGPQVLSAVAGAIWRMDGELWVRNLSTAHELQVAVPGRPPDSPLPPRLTEADRGAARSIPVGVAYILAPGGCALLVRQEVFSTMESSPNHNAVSGRTVRLSPVPDDLRPVAAALCEPLLEGSALPASYARIGHRIGVASRKAVRLRVDSLIEFYATESPDLQRRRAERREREAAGLSAQPPTLRQGVWRFDSGPATDDHAERERRMALALPDYVELAHLLVRRGIVTARDVSSLLPSTGEGDSP